MRQMLALLRSVFSWQFNDRAIRKGFTPYSDAAPFFILKISYVMPHSAMANTYSGRSSDFPSSINGLPIF